MITYDLISIRKHNAYGYFFLTTCSERLPKIWIYLLFRADVGIRPYIFYLREKVIYGIDNYISQCYNSIIFRAGCDS